MMRSVIKKIITAFVSRKRRRDFYNLFKKTYLLNNTFNLKEKLSKEQEQEWLEKYRKIDKKVRIDSLRIYSKYVSNYMNIIPYETYSLYFSPLLNPVRFNGFYDDKNDLDMILPKEYIADTVLRRVDGIFRDVRYAVLHLNSDQDLYSFLEVKESYILKPSYISGGGNSVVKIIYEEKDQVWKVEDKILTIQYLLSYNSNFIIQKCIKQSPFMSQFNKSSVNTFRMCIYRSVENNNIDLLVNLLRIGKEGNVADNILLGGMCARIDQRGKISKELFDVYGNLSTQFNNIDFVNNDFQVPNYSKIVEWGKSVASYFPHHHLLALDIALDENNEPKLVEVNASAFSIEMLYFAHVDMFGKYTDEVYNFVLNHYNNRTKRVALFV